VVRSSAASDVYKRQMLIMASEESKKAALKAAKEMTK
jgi:hypothetical protein